MKKTVVFDFDGVINSYSSGWRGAGVLPDPPVDGIKEAIEELRDEGYRVAVVSTRAAQKEGEKAIWSYLDRYGIKVDSVSSEKPPAICYIDDRAICFDGRPENLYRKIKDFRPWNKM